MKIARPDEDFSPDCINCNSKTSIVVAFGGLFETLIDLCVPCASKLVVTIDDFLEDPTPVIKRQEVSHRDLRKIGVFNISNLLERKCPICSEGILCVNRCSKSFDPQRIEKCNKCKTDFYYKGDNPFQEWGGFICNWDGDEDHDCDCRLDGLDY